MTVTVKQQRCCRLKELEAAAEQLQAALLAELDGPSQTGGTGSKKKSKAKKGKKKQVCTLQAATCVATLKCCFVVTVVSLKHYGMVTPVFTCLFLSFSDPVLVSLYELAQMHIFRKRKPKPFFTQRGTHKVHFSCSYNVCYCTHTCNNWVALVTCLAAGVTTVSPQEPTEVSASMACTLLSLLSFAAGFSSCAGGGSTWH